MNETETTPGDQVARGLAAGFGGSGIPEADFRRGGNDPMQSHAQVQGLASANREGQKAMALPLLAEMGDIAPAIEVLLRLQAEYARREPGVSRAMRDVAYNAVAIEIERYIRSRSSCEYSEGAKE